MQTPITTLPRKSAVLTSLPPVTRLDGQSSVAEKVAEKGSCAHAASLTSRCFSTSFYLQPSALPRVQLRLVTAAPEWLRPTCVSIRRKEEPSPSCPSLWRALSATTSTTLPSVPFPGSGG